jgi:nitric oxide synthase-interacting protein
VTCSGGGASAKSDSKAKVHLFCRECALNDLMAQRQEIKRLEREAEMRERDREDEKRRADEENRRQDLERFERGEMGFEDVQSSSSNNKKRRAEEMHASTSTSASRSGQTDESTPPKRVKGAESETSFWIPGGDKSKSVTDAPTKATKLHALCPGSTPESKHAYSLKGLIRVKLSESDDGSRACPSCQKVLSNTSRPMLGTAEGCGHVVCGGCADLLASSSDQVACYVCEADLSPPQEREHAANEGTGENDKGRGHAQNDATGKSKAKKAKDKKDGSKGRLVEISCEGTGFAGGGANMAKREGVAFQC